MTEKTVQKASTPVTKTAPAKQDAPVKQSAPDVDALKSMINSLKEVPSPQCFSGAPLVLAADLARIKEIRINDAVIHGKGVDTGVKVHPVLKTLLVVLALLPTWNPRSDRGRGVIEWASKNGDLLKPVEDRIAVVTFKGGNSTASVGDILSYARAASKLRVEINGEGIRTRKSSADEDEGSYSFI